MKSLCKLSTRVFALLLFALPHSAMAQDSGASDADPVVAQINGAPLLQSEVKEAIGNLPPQYQANIESVLPTLIERLIDFRLMSDAGRAQGLATDAEVLARLARLESAVIRDVYLERHLESAVTDEKLRARYDEQQAARGATEEVQARHILLATEEEAQATIAELDAGADFAELAKERSTGPSGPQGGDLGFFSAEQMVPPFSEAAFALQPGEYSKAPVQTRFGFHVILVEQRRAVEPPSFEAEKPALSDELRDEAVQAMVAELREKATVEMVKVPLATDLQ